MIDPGLLQELIRAASAAGADAAEAVAATGAGVEVSYRLGKLEKLERSESQGLTLRVFVGRQVASVEASEIDPRRFVALAERAVAMARVVPEDSFAGLAEEAQFIDAAPLDLLDLAEQTVAELTERAARAEAAALAVAGVTNSDGAGASGYRGGATMVTSHGFVGQWQSSSHSVGVSALAGQGTGMQRDYDFHTAVHLADLEDAAMLGRRAGERAVSRMAPRRPATARIPVVYDPRVASSLLGHLMAAIAGPAVARGTSFLRDRLGSAVFAPGIVVHDDPHRRRGLGSRMNDADGVPTAARRLIDDGVLTGWLLDVRSARQLGLRTTGNATRGGGVAASNLYLAAGRQRPDTLMADIREGVYVTEMMGSAVNGLTGDYSRGAAGFMIRDGALAEPVAEITIAGNLKDMFAAMVPADDLSFRRGVNAPTVRIDGLTVAGG